MQDEIYVTKPSLPPIEEYIEYLKGIWESRTLTNLGGYWQTFSLELRKKIGVEFCLPFTNGHMALELTIQAFGLEGEVITTPFTFASTTHAIVRNDLEPVFCDIRESDCTIDCDQIENLITEKTSAIVPVHVYGMPCDVERIETIAQKHGLKVIYDAAHAFGETLDGKSLASYGDAAMMSFHATKAFHTIEGGCSIVHDPQMAKRLYQLQNFGIMGEEDVEYAGANAKMNEFQAAMGLCNLKYFESNVQKRKVVYDYYHETLQKIPGIKLLQHDASRTELNYTYCPIFIDGNIYGKNRDEVYELLKEQHIHARKYFFPLTSQFQCYHDRGFRGETKVAERMANQVLTLPLYAELSLEDVKRICAVLERR